MAARDAGHNGRTAALRRDMLDVLNVHAGLRPKAIEEVDVATARANPSIADAVEVLLREQGRSTHPEELVPGITSIDTTVQGAAGELPATVYLPDGPGPFPVIVYFHGGGWVIADRKACDGAARGLARAATAVVVSVDYRLAPEHLFPAAWEDALAAWRYVLQTAAQWGGDSRHVAIAGEDAGGNLALATAIAARDADLQVPAHVLVVCPVTQAGRTANEWFFRKLVRSREDLRDPRLQLIDAPLRHLPPVTIISAHVDPLREDGVKLEDALLAAGVPVERRDFDGVTHEFFGCAAVVGKAREAQAYAGERLVASLSGMVSSTH